MRGEIGFTRWNARGALPMKRRAYAYIRKDIADIYLERCEREIRSHAKDLGYDLARTIVDDPQGRGIVQLFRLLCRPDAGPDTLVLLYSLRHIPDTSLDDFGEFAHVETLIPPRRWAKRPTESVTVRPRKSGPDVSEETKTVPAVADLRASIAEAEHEYRKIAEP